MQPLILKSYPYQQYQDDPNIVAFFDAYNSIAQGYMDYVLGLNLPIYTQLSGPLLDWVGQGLYGFQRPTISILSGAVFGSGIFGNAIFGVGGIGSALVSDDIYQRCLTWKMYRGDGFNITIPWMKKRIQRFILGANGTSPVIDNTSFVSITVPQSGVMQININAPAYASVVYSFVQCLNNGILDWPFQYPFNIQSAA